MRRWPRWRTVNARAQQYEDSGAFGDTRMDVLRAYAYLDLLNGVAAETRIACAEAQDETAEAAGPWPGPKRGRRGPREPREPREPRPRMARMRGPRQGPVTRPSLPPRPTRAPQST